MTHARLLLVDDDPDAIRIMSRMLAEFPDQRFATSGADALRIARDAPPDLILLDAEMPGMSGLDICEAMKADERLARIPIIFATSHNATALEVGALERGAADFVTKPLVASQLMARVRAQLRTTRLRDSLRLGGPHTAPPRDEPGAPRLLIVDDDVSAIRMLRHTLAALGDFHFAKSGAEALRLASQLLPDLILLDAHMPEIDGFAVCATLKSQAAFRHVPIVFVTRYADPASETRALDLGAAEFIAKPYIGAVLHARVRNLLDLKRRTDTDLVAVREHWRQVGDARVADIVQSASEAILSFDAESRIVLANAAACQMFGARHEHLVGQPVHAVLGDRLPDIDRCAAAPTRITLLRDASDAVPVEVSVSSVGAGAERLTTIMLRDIGDRERLEAESRARAAAESAAAMQAKMLSYLAHEIGNPLNGMLGFAQLMGMDDAHLLPPAQALRLEQILASGRQLQTLMRDVLDVGRFESGRLSFDTADHDATRCAGAAVQAVAAQAALAGIALSVAAPPVPLVLRADADRLQQCLVNLLSNAIKYNRAAGWVQIGITADADTVALAVCDGGIGIDAEQRTHLFEPFNRLGRQRSAAPGVGLGLVITHRLVTAMGGRLLVESDPAVGSCFTVVLPRAPASTGVDRLPALTCAS